MTAPDTYLPRRWRQLPARGRGGSGRPGTLQIARRQQTVPRTRRSRSRGWSPSASSVVGERVYYRLIDEAAGSKPPSIQEARGGNDDRRERPHDAAGGNT